MYLDKNINGMLIQEYHPRVNHQHQQDTNHLIFFDHNQSLSKPILITLTPTESQINQYMKMLYLQTHDFNSHVDRVRMNYIKLKNKNKKNSLTTVTKDLSLLSFQQKVQASLPLHQHSYMSEYLKQLEENSRTSTLPTEIINNKTLCSLYNKLDLFQNNLISQHQKQQLLNNKILINKQQLQSQSTITENKLTKHQHQWTSRHQQMLSSLKKILSTIQLQFESLSQNFSINRAHLLQSQQSNLMKKEYVQALYHETQNNIKLIQNKIKNLTHQLGKVQQQQIENLQINHKIQQTARQIKQLMCQIYRRQSMF